MSDPDAFVTAPMPPSADGAVSHDSAAFLDLAVRARASWEHWERLRRRLDERGALTTEAGGEVLVGAGPGCAHHDGTTSNALGDDCGSGRPTSDGGPIRGDEPATRPASTSTPRSSP